MISSHLAKINRTSNYDFLNRFGYSRLDRNERNYPFSKQVLKKLKKTITNYSLQAYPSDKYKLIKKIAVLEKINSKYIEIVPGSDAAIKYIFEIFSFEKNKLASIFPTYGMVNIYSKIYKTTLYKVSSTNENFNANLYFKKKIGWIYIANPNQPDGKIISKENIINILKIADKKNVFVVIDEAYIQFSKQKSLINLVKRFKNLIVLRTFSKFPGLAGIRIGYLAANPKFIEIFNTVRPIFDTSSLSILIAEFFIKNKKIGINYLKEINKIKEFMVKECKKRKLNFINTETNFFYIKIPGKKIKLVHTSLMKNKILVRSSLLGNFKFIDNTIRITLGQKKIMIKLFKVLDKINLEIK
jgi:histidinol-phosphate aminotransferase